MAPFKKMSGHVASKALQSARVFVSIFFFAREGDGAEPDGEPTDGAARVRRCDCAAGRRHQLCASKRAAVVALSRDPYETGSAAALDNTRADPHCAAKGPAVVSLVR